MKQSPFRIDTCGTVIFMRKNEVPRAAAIAAAAIGPGLVTGRETAAFFAQTATASRLGVLCAGAVFGACVTGIARVRQTTGARNTAELAARLPNRVGGGALCAAHGALLAVVSAMMLAVAWKIGALALPLRCGGAIGAISALLGAIALANVPSEVQAGICAAFYGGVILYALALFRFGRLPAAAHTYIETELKLAGNGAAAALLGTIHACTRACIAANIVLRGAEPREKPRRIGLYSGGMYALCLAILNAAIRRQPDFVAALRMPLTALASGWGGAGFALVAGMTFFSGVIALYAAILPIVGRKSC